MTEIHLTVEEAAERLRMHPATIRRRIESGDIRAAKVFNVYRIPESEIERLLSVIEAPAKGANDARSG